MAGTSFTVYNLYYELPGAGGGNIQFDSVADARDEFESMTKAYPDIYALLDVKYSNIFATGHKIEEYNGNQNV